MQDHYLFFDLDGTLSDSKEGIFNSLRYTFRKLGTAIPKETELFRFIGPPLLDSFEQFCGMNPKQAEEAVGIYREYYNVRGIFECSLYPGIRELLEEAKQRGFHLVLATCKPAVSARRVLEHLSLAPLFELVSGPEFDGTRNTKEEVIAYAMQQLGIGNPASVLMIGDRKDDVNGANRNRMDSVGVLWGYGTKEELSGAGTHNFVNTPSELLRFIENRTPFFENR